MLARCFLKQFWGQITARSQQKSVWLFVYFLSMLCWPSLAALLDPQPGQHILDIACDNGSTSRRLAALGAHVIAFDFSFSLVEKTNARSANRNSDQQPLRALTADVKRMVASVRR